MVMFAARFKGIARAIGLASLIGCCLYSHQSFAGTEVVWKDVRDLQLGNGLFHLYQNKNFSGIIELSKALEQRKIKTQTTEARLALAMLYLSYGLHRTAAARTANLTTKGQLYGDIRNHLWFYISNIRYQRGYFNQAEGALANITGALPLELEQKLKSFSALLLMDRRQYPLAMRKLEDIKGNTTDVPFARYNLAVSLSQLEQTENSNAVLNQIAIMDSHDGESRNLIDRANLQLGYKAIINNDPKQALKYFEKIHLYGAQSNSALLGLGWAHYNLEQYERALVPWNELSERNISDTSVQEAMVAIPYTMTKLEAFAQALNRYEIAFESFKNEHHRINNTIQSVKKGTFFNKLLENDNGGEGGWLSEINELPDMKEVSYFYQLLARHDFQETMKNYRDLIFISNKLDTWERDLDAYEETMTYWANRIAQSSNASASQAHNKKAAALRRDRDNITRELQKIEKNKNALTLATEKEQEQIYLLNTYAAQLKASSTAKANKHQLHIIRLMQGRLKWKIYSRFDDQIKQLKSGLEEANAAINAATEKQAAILDAAHSAKQKVAKIRPKLHRFRATINKMRPGIKGALGAAKSYLKTTSLKSLEARKDIMSEFLAQVAFSVAQTHDKAYQDNRKD